MSADAYGAWCAAWGEIGTAMRSVGWSARCAMASRQIICGEITRGQAITQLEQAGVPRQLAKSQTFASDAVGSSYGRPGGMGPRR